MAHDNDPLATLVQTYHELNPSVIDELVKTPDALEFMRYVARNRPFVVRGGAGDWPAVQKWNAHYLREIMKDEQVKVAITPHGAYDLTATHPRNADAVVEDPSGRLTFVEPYEISEPFSSFLASIQDSSSSNNPPSTSLSTKDPKPHVSYVKYAQTQNDNLRDEYSRLFPDVPASLPFADTALAAAPDAINFWLGDSRSTTALHKDNYENVYVQVRGAKHFVLLPPVEAACVNERALPVGRFRPRRRPRPLAEEGAEAERDVGKPEEGEVGDDAGWDGELEIGMEGKDDSGAEADAETGTGTIPVAVWDPDEPEKRPTRYSDLSRPLKVTLGEGDMLYLPAMWYHKVGQSEGDEGFACSVNYWYDMEFSGGFWATNAFVRDVTLGAAKQVTYPALSMGDGEGEKGSQI